MWKIGSNIIIQDVWSQDQSLKKEEIQSEKECHYCKQMILDSSFQTHLEFCKTYSKLFAKSNDGYDCMECSFKGGSPKEHLNNIYIHIKTHHLEKLKSLKKAK